MTFWNNCKWAFSLLCLSGSLGAQTVVSDEPCRHVDPFIGTGFVSHLYPGAALPFGMVQLSPDTYNEGWDYCAGYRYADRSIMGFSHTHFSGMGGTAGGDILLMPATGQELHIFPGTRENPDGGYRSRFSHVEESASPGYYSVLLEDYAVKAELTVSRRAGMHRYTFLEPGMGHILLDLGHIIGELPEGESYLKIVGNDRIQGYKISKEAVIFFVAKFSKPCLAYGTWDKGVMGSPYKSESTALERPFRSEEAGKNIGAFFDYRLSKGEVIMVKVGLSYVSMEGAGNNLDTEIPHWDFDRVKAEAEQCWNAELSKIRIRGTAEQKQIFYTALYHSLVAQTISSDADNRYFGMDGKAHRFHTDFYPTFLCWDTYRTEQPLMTLLEPQRTGDMIASIVRKTQDFGWLPGQHIRNHFGQGMIGDHLVPIVVDAFVKGIKGYDTDFIFRAMKDKATKLPPVSLPAGTERAGILACMKKGYVPVGQSAEPVSNTLEFAYDDWCIATMAEVMGKREDFAVFRQRAANYRNVYDRETGFMRPRMEDGNWLTCCGDREPEIVGDGNRTWYDCFDPLWIGKRPNRHFTESNAWQYLWAVQHDIGGLMELMGGRKAFSARLDSLFEMTALTTGPEYVGVVGTIGQYVHGNQPSHHVAYLYNYAGEPWKSQERLREVMDKFYRTGPGGLCGNEDMGSLSSWYVFSAMGFYPVCPGQTVYVIGTPVLEEAVISLEKPYAGKTFTVRAPNVSSENKYIRTALLNGKPLTRTWISHEEITRGGTLEFEMDSKPNKKWGSGEKDVPPSLTRQ
jgi:predicted alpha-1,2-mannosidase